jgi:outer membrane autotransporter protein
MHLPEGGSEPPTKNRGKAMKLLAVAAASMLLVLGSAHAQTRPAGPLYGEVGYTFMQVDDGGVKTNPGSIRGVIGYDFHPYFAVEGMAAFGAGDDSTDTTVGGVAVHVTEKSDYQFGIFVKPKYDFQNVELFGRLGWAQTHLKRTASGGGVSVDASDTGSDFAWGLGVNYRFNPKMYVGVDYLRYYDKGGVTIDGWTVGFGYRF